MIKKLLFVREVLRTISFLVWILKGLAPEITFLGPYIGIRLGRDIVRLKPSCFPYDMALVIMHLFPHYRGRLAEGIHMAAYHYHLGFKPLAAIAVGNVDWGCPFLPVWVSHRHFSEVVWFGRRLYATS